jgi:hypothetical protein
MRLRHGRRELGEASMNMIEQPEAPGRVPASPRAASARAPPADIVLPCHDPTLMGVAANAIDSRWRWRSSRPGECRYSCIPDTGGVDGRKGAPTRRAAPPSAKGDREYNEPLIVDDVRSRNGCRCATACPIVQPQSSTTNAEEGTPCAYLIEL